MIQGWHQNVPIWIGLGRFKSGFPYDLLFGQIVDDRKGQKSKSWNRCTTGRQWSGPPGNQNPLIKCSAAKKGRTWSDTQWDAFSDTSQRRCILNNTSPCISKSTSNCTRSVRPWKRSEKSANPTLLASDQRDCIGLKFTIKWIERCHFWHFTANKGFSTSNPNLHKGHLQ